MVYTEQDKNAAYQFSRYNYLVNILTYIQQRYPHLVQDLKIIEEKNKLAYYVPPALAGQCSSLTVQLTEKTCHLLSCNKFKVNSFCQSTDSTSVFRLGDSIEYDFHCQPSCFSQLPYQPPRLNWVAGRAVIVPDAISGLEKPTWFAPGETISRVTDLPIGFSRISHDKGCGYKFKLNSSYCKCFDKIYNEKTGECENTIAKQIAEFTLGLNIYRDVILNTYNKLATGSIFPELALPQMSPIIPEYFESVDKWFSYRNSTDQRMPLLKKYNIKRNATTRYESTQNQSASNQNARYIQGQEYLTSDEFHDNISKLVGDILVITVAGLATDIAIGKLINETIPAIERSLHSMLESTSKLAGYVFEKHAFNSALEIGVKISLGRQITDKILAKIFSTLASTLSFATDGIALFSLVDFVFGFIVDTGYSNYRSEEMLDKMVYGVENQFQEKMKTSSLEYTFDMFVANLVPSDVISLYEAAQLLDCAIYLESLDVNSDGKIIERFTGNSIDFSNGFVYDDAILSSAYDRLNSTLITSQNSLIAKKRYEESARQAKFSNIVSLSILSGSLGIALISLATHSNFLIQLTYLLVAFISIFFIAIQQCQNLLHLLPTTTDSLFVNKAVP